MYCVRTDLFEGPSPLPGPAPRLCCGSNQGADVAEREGGGGSELRLERQEHQHDGQERQLLGTETEQSLEV